MTQLSASACRQCAGPLPKMPPSQQRVYCSRTCAGQAKRTLPASKTCTVCQSDFTPTTRYQAARNLTCSPKCAAKAVSTARLAAEPRPRTKTITVSCAECGAEFQRPLAWLKRTKSPTCSRQCNGKARGQAFAAHGHKGRAGWSPESVERWRQKMLGATNPAWKGGVTYKRPKGNYIGPRYVRCPPDLWMMARTDKYIAEHRLVMARWIGRPLLRTEVVNHIDHNPRNNVRENLELYPSNADHKRGEAGHVAEGVANHRFLPDWALLSNLLGNRLS